MNYGESNGHVTDDMTWPWKVQLVSRDSNTLTAGDAIYQRSLRLG